MAAKDCRFNLSHNSDCPARIRANGDTESILKFKQKANLLKYLPIQQMGFVHDSNGDEVIDPLHNFDFFVELTLGLTPKIDGLYAKLLK